MLKDNNLEAVILNTTLDSHFITLMESKEEGVQFSRIDSDLTEILKADVTDESPEENKAIEEIFKNSINKEQLKISIEPIKTEEVPAMITLSEQSRRMAEMSVMFGGGDMSMFPKEETLVVNSSNPLIKKLFNLSKDENKKDLVNDICNHVYDLAMISHGQLGADEMSDFIKRSNDLLGRLIN